VRDALDEADLEGAQRDVGRAGLDAADPGPSAAASRCARRSLSVLRSSLYACAWLAHCIALAFELPPRERFERLLGRVVDCVRG
jgi:hypothetical protein